MENTSVRSMTGFGAAVCEKEDYKITIEVKSVNNRYKDVSAHLPAGLRTLEPLINDHLNKYSLRGKIDIYVNFVDYADDNKIFIVDKELVLSYQKALSEIAAIVNSAPLQKGLSVNDLIALSAYPGVLTREDKVPNVEYLKEDFTKTLEEALSVFIQMKTVEGANLCRDILYRLSIIREKTDCLCDLNPAIVEKYRQNLITALGEYLNANDIDQTRIIQETAIYAEKTNYTEETTRLKSHLIQFEQTLTSCGNIGRKLDFIIQEMNREINTIASKANSAEAGQLVVDVKGEIEKIREQIQNIE
ncbi:YicC/YloC family endoribonuclease [Pectinatus cerevisiiphilus]|nr:YicC/YloC family endoribonuclease [Pectinatus cerevisiiphilus]